MLQSSWLLLLLVSLLLVSGCGQQLKAPVSGMVTFERQPVEDGQIAFEPTGNQKMEFAPISHGQYSLPVEYGLLPGEYTVRITGNRATGKQVAADSFLRSEEGLSLEIVEQFIPQQYNVASTLKLHVESTGEIRADFELKAN